MPTTDLPAVDLQHPECDPPDCPSWAKELVPPAIQPFRGRNGLPEEYRRRPGVSGESVAGIDRYHANHIVIHRPETARFLRDSYTPTSVNDFVPGRLPNIEVEASRLAQGCSSQREVLQRLLVDGVSRVRHPDMPPCGPDVPPDRNLDDEAIWASGAGWCNEQARVLVRLCQACGIAARLVFLYYSDRRTGHTIAEAHVDGGWAMVDASWFCVFPDPDGRLLSAPQCHDGGAGQMACGEAYQRRFEQLLAMDDHSLNFNPRYRTAAQWRDQMGRQTAEDHAQRLYLFGIINYPWPTT